MNKKCVALTHEQYVEILLYLRRHFNHEIADICMIEASTSLRVSDVVSLKKSEIVQDADRFRFQKLEKKTKKIRTFTFSSELYNYLITNYAFSDDYFFHISVRRVQQAVSSAAAALNLHNISTHSFRKYFATQIYNDTHDIYLVSQLLQHSSIAITQRYICLSSERVEKALENHKKSIIF